jgi:hypothetical protein
MLLMKDVTSLSATSVSVKMSVVTSSGSGGLLDVLLVGTG